MAMTQQEVIKKFMASLDKTTKRGTAALDEAIKACSNFQSIQDVIEKILKDCRNAKNADDFLKNYCGINIEGKSTEDTGSITGKDAGGSKVKTAESIVTESGSLKNFTGSQFTVNGVTIQLANIDNEGNFINELSFKNLTDSKQKYIWQGLYTWWIKAAFQLISESYGSNFLFNSNSSVKKIYLGFYEANDSQPAVTSPGHSVYNGIPVNGKTTVISLRINMSAFKNIKLNDLNGKTTYTEANTGKTITRYLDRTLAHELTHAVMAANINYEFELPRFVSEGIAELTHGINDVRKNDIKILAGNYSELKKGLNLTETDAVSAYEYSGGYIFFRYLAKQAVNSPLITTNFSNNTVLSGSEMADSIVTYGKKVVVNGNGGDDYIFDGGQGSNVTIYGGAGNDTIKTWAANGYIDGGAGNDFIEISGKSVSGNTINAGWGNDTIYGGSLGSVFLYANGDGNDIIHGVTNKDTIKITGGSYEKVTLSSSSDVTLKVGTGSLILKNAKDKKYKIDGEEYSPVITNKTKNKLINGTDANETIKNYADKVTVIAGAGNDSIKNSGANATNALIYGGAGNDSIYSSGKNVTIYAGNDNDYVYIYKSYTENNKVFYSGSHIIYAGSGNDTIVNYSPKSKMNGEDGADSIKNYAENVTIEGGAGKDNIYSSGKNVAIFGGNDNDYIHIYKTYTGDNSTIYSGSHTVDAGSGNDTIVNYSPQSKINGGVGNDSIRTDNNNVTIEAGTGNDYISLSSAAKNNLIVYNSGDGTDTVYGINADDTLKITGAKFTTLKSGSDFKVIIGSGSILLKNAANIAFKINDTLEGGTTLPAGISIKNSVLTASTKFTGSKINLADYPSVTQVNASALSKAVNISGTSTNDYLQGGKGADTLNDGSGDDILFGGNGNDTLYGTNGNDSLSGGAGKDIFYHFDNNGDKDVITDYTAGQDTIKIAGGTISKTSYSGKDVIFTIGNSSLTVKNGKGKKITITDSSEKTSTKTYSSGVSARTLDLLYDNNFMTYDTNLDSITEQKFSVTEIQPSNIETFAQDSTLLTFAKDK